MGKKETLSAQDKAELDALNNQTYSSDEEELNALNASLPNQPKQSKKVTPAPQVPKGGGVLASESGTSGLGVTTSDYLTFQTAEEKLAPKKTTSQIPMAPKKEPSVKQTSQVGKGVTGVQGPAGLTDLKNVTGPMGATGAVGVTGATDKTKKQKEQEYTYVDKDGVPITGAMGVSTTRKTKAGGVRGVTEKTSYLVPFGLTEEEKEEKKKDAELSIASKAFDNFKLKTKDSGYGEIQEATNFYLDYLKSTNPDEYKYQSERLNYNKDNPLERQKIEVEFINKGLDLKRKAIAGKSKEISLALFMDYDDEKQKFKDINSQLDVLVPKIEQINSELSSYTKDQNGNIIVNETNKRKVEKLISDYKTEYKKYEGLIGQRDELLNSDFGTLIKKADELAQEDKKNYEYAINLEKTIKESDKYPELKKQLIEEAFLKETENKFWDEMPEWVKWSVDSFSGFKRAGTELIKGLTFLPKAFGEKAGYGWTDKFAEFSDKMISDYERIEAPISPNAKKNIFDYERNPDGTPKLDEKGNKIEKTNWSAIPYQVSNGAGNLALFIVSGGAGTALESANLLSKIGLGARGVSALNKIGTFAMGYTMSAKGNYDEAKANGMSEADAIAYSKYKSIADGAIELIFPEQKLITPTVRKSAAKLTAQYLSKGVPLKDAISRVTKETLGNVVGENVEELAALGTDYAAKVIAEKATGTDFKVDDDLMNQVKSTVLVTSILTAPFGIVGAKGVKNQMENQSLFLAANKPNEVLQNIQDLLDSKVITEEQANTARERIKIAEEGLKSIPKEYSDDKKATALSLLVDKKILENKKKEIDPVFHENIDAQIKEKDAEIKKDISRDDNGLTLEQNDELEDLMFKKDNGVITEAEQNKLDELNKFVEDYKKPKAEKTTKTMVTVETIPEGQRFPVVTTMAKEEFEAYKQANPTANIVFERDVEVEKKPEEETEVEQETKKQEDAVQEQTTGQVPLQPETKIGGEMEEGKPQAELEISAQKVEEKPIAKEEVKVEEGDAELTALGDKKVEPKILLSGLSDGFKPVSFESFDVRKDEIAQQVMKGGSFAKTITDKGKKYLVVGLELKTKRPADTSGRDNYSFAAAELNESTPKNIVDILEKAAKENFKNIYSDFSNTDVVKEITVRDAELNALEGEAKPKEEVKVEEKIPATTQVISEIEKIPDEDKKFLVEGISGDVGGYESYTDKSAGDLRGQLVNSKDKFTSSDGIELQGGLIENESEDGNNRIITLGVNKTSLHGEMINGKLIGGTLVDHVGRNAYYSVSISVPKDSKISKEDVKQMLVDKAAQIASDSKSKNPKLRGISVASLKGTSKDLVIPKAKEEVKIEEKKAIEKPIPPVTKQEVKVTPKEEVKVEEKVQVKAKELPKDQAGRTVGSTNYVTKENPKGRTVTRTSADGTRIKGTFKLVSAEDLLPSHNPKTFAKNESFPQNKEGKTINDRDYEAESDAQGEVIRIAQNIDVRAITQTPIVSKEGIVYDGNNRTMSRQLAAENKTDSQYLEDLNDQAEMYGFTKEQVASVKNPTLVFEVEENLPFTTEVMRKFNKEEKKGQAPIQRAVAISKSISDKARRKIASLYDQVETPSEVTSDPKMMKQAVDILLSEGLIQSVELPRFYDKGVATPDGVSLLEGIVLASALDEDGIRAIGVEGMGNVRKMIIKNTVGLIQNATKGENALTKEIKGAIDITQKAKASKMSVSDFLSQTSAFDEKTYSLGEMLMALLLETNSPNKLKQFLSNYNQDVGVENLMGEDTSKQALLQRGLENLISNYEKAKQNLQRVAEGGIEEGGRGTTETEAAVRKEAEPTAKEEIKKEEPKKVPSVKPEDIKVNVGSTTQQGFEDLYTQDESIPYIEEGPFVAITDTRDKLNGFAIRNGTLRVRVGGRDRFGRSGGGTQVSVKLPEGFDSKVFSDKLNNISHEGGVTTETATAKVVEDIRKAISESSLVDAKVEEKTIKQKAEDLNKKIDAATEKLKNTIVDKNANNRLFSAPMITPKMISDLIDLSSAVIKKSITAGATIAQAVNDGINAIKNHPRYKRFVEAGQINEENFEKQVRDNYADLIKEEETKAQEEAKKKEEEAKKKAPPAKPPVTTEAEKGPAPEGKKERATATRILENKKFHEDVVKRLSNEAIFYEPTSVKKSEEFVNAVIDEYEANGKLDDLVNEYMADKSDIIPDNQKLLFGDFLTKKLEDIATKEQNEFVRETLFDKAEQVFEKTAKNTTTAAQQLALIRNRDTRMFSNEIYMRRYAKKQFSEMQDNAMSEAQKNDIKSAQEIINEYRKSNEFAKEVEQATAEELKKIAETREGAGKVKQFNDIIDSLKVNLSDC